MKKICVFLLTVMIASGAYLIVNAQSSAAAAKTIYYRQEPIRTGDTLWSVAEKYKPDGKGTKQFVQEIMDLNQLRGDTIFAGNSLIVPIYR